ncbi:hypothetical protein HCN44_005636 [Aphidius gifuensis]|uniref:Dual serine/threonine and tyrosine protein kinase n=1 Tax=Aphidius gifuensis TaxID=684658 RepID=A0A834Y546_APHGI|nr:dual serine/threonine and tyrosine protein kinase-like isoform X2 [Aphidius gifuensis]XP_044001303.1 dual serine/threonine and tyrosine protein kinase-like isoform X2 [Aphidius gifuensis]KAF7997359.1 hypothetical protein HCN44_005636 [Aphidius gifuensis]
MVSKLPQEFRRYHRNRNQLRHIFKETKRTLEIISQENFFPDENIIEELQPSVTLERLIHILENQPAIVISGQDCKSKTTLINHLLGDEILPLVEGQCRWIRFSYGNLNNISLTLGLEYEVIEQTQSNELPWTTIPIDYLIKTDTEDPNCPTIVDVKLDKLILKDGVQIFIVPDMTAIKHIANGTLGILPIFIYAFNDYPLTDENINELRELKETYPYNPVIFISSLSNITFDSIDADLTESEQHRLQNQSELLLANKTTTATTTTTTTNVSNENINIGRLNNLGLKWLDELGNLGFFKTYESDEFNSSSDLVESLKNIDRIHYFIRTRLQLYLIDASNYLNEIHTTSLRKFILSAFDMAREIQITPRRIQYAQKKENELYKSLMKVVSKNQEELTDLIQNTIQTMKNEFSLITNDSCKSENENSNIDDEENKQWCATVRSATTEVQRIVLSHLSEKVAKQLVTSVNCLRETFVGTLQRCLYELEKTYDNDNNLLASDALKQILSAAYNVELHNSSPSLVHSFLERLRQLFKSMPLPWTPTPILDDSWKKKITIDILNSLSAARLAKTISAQFRDKIKSSHDSFHSALRSLENHYSGKLERTEEQRITIRKIYAPKLAKLALESTSMSDMIRYGIPHQGKEIGRGQYGVVFSCDGWGGAPGPCAVKSVVPPDEKHWNDLAMEFYYTRTIPNHKRIVKLRGSVIDHSYGGGCGLGAAVLLITDRMTRDLYCGIRTGITWIERIQISIDVLEGIRYLHSQGLVHRDIKLKNVLLDIENRAKLTDLGFCITEAMMSGSVVGTPVHMAPELLTGHYDSSVDVYAFGILFWYLCAGHVRMPYAFEQFHNKEQLWTSVRRGLRPERLPHFEDECWQLMEQCWAGEPSKRPLLGAILPVLESILEKTETNLTGNDSEGSKQSNSSETIRNPALALAEPNNQRGTTIDSTELSLIETKTQNY